MTPIRTLVDRDKDKLKSSLLPGLRVLYDGDLQFQTSPAERPFVFANFVSTLDGVVSYAIKGQTVLDTEPQRLWTSESVYPDAQHLYAEYRVNVLHKPQRPLLVVVSGSGKLELGRAIFRMPEARTVVMTTPAGRDAPAVPAPGSLSKPVRAG